MIIKDNSENNTVTVITENQNLGIGDYEFSMDDINGPYDENPTFTQVPPGEHTIFVREKNDCGIAQVTIFVFGFPNFFTPNNDGKNDTFQPYSFPFIKCPRFVNSLTFTVYNRWGKEVYTESSGGEN